ncbi:MAG: deoxyribodipyrimidine photo-lyase [Melioribacteraceae bacterium]
MNPKRMRIIKEGKQRTGPVVYWMQRDQRAHDNWALIYAQQMAIQNNVPLITVFNLVPDFLDAAIRQYDFMLKGLEETESELIKCNISLRLLTGDSGENIPKFVDEINAEILISDFNPLKIVRRWKKSVAGKISIPFHEVDAHNIVPSLLASDKTDFGAYTIRPKIERLLPEFMDEYPALKKMKSGNLIAPKINWKEIRNELKINFEVPQVGWIRPGENSAHKFLKDFIIKKLPGYNEKRNDPNENATSGLSPYLHFGHLSAQRAALMVQQAADDSESKNAFLEELIIRRELSDNFCYFNVKYDSCDGFPDWAKKSLDLHRKDKREFIYSKREFENAETHDELWNAAQTEMVCRGKMHGYMRMYWAKKIYEWSPSPEDAMKTAIYLNDKYELDGRDPNGYAGIAWSIGGVHDRAWFERPVYGKIRYMNANGCAKKFDVKKYISSHIKSISA